MPSLPICADDSATSRRNAPFPDRGLKTCTRLLRRSMKLQLRAGVRRRLPGWHSIGSCATCRAAVDMFCAMLGTVAGNLALMFRARGGVYLAGGIAPRLADYLAQSEFRARFEAKGRFREYLESIPTTIIVNPDAAFLGLKSLAERRPRHDPDRHVHAESGDRHIDVDRTDHADPQAAMLCGAPRPRRRRHQRGARRQKARQRGDGRLSARRRDRRVVVATGRT